MSKLKKKKSIIYSLIFISLVIFPFLNNSLVKTTFAVENQTNTNIEKSNEKYIFIIQNIRSLLEQLSNAYKMEDYQKADQLAITAYLDNYEYLEAPLEITGNADLMKEIELMMREDLRDVIKEKVSQQEIDKLIDDINMKLFDAVIVLDPK